MSFCPWIHLISFVLYKVVIGVPTLTQRLAILKVLFEKIPVCPTVNLAELAQRTTGYVGADLNALCREAIMHAVRENAKVNTDKHTSSPSNPAECTKPF